MALEESRFFDSVDNDKQYTAEQFAEYFRQFLASGVYDTGTNLQVAATSGMVVSIGYGAAMIDGYGYWLKDNSGGAKTLTIGAANTQPRIDRIVLRLDKSVGTRSVILAVKAGTPAASPAAPALTRSGNVYEISLAQILVGANVVQITAGNITDERTDTSVCGMVEPKRMRDTINQGVKTTDSPTFAAATVSGTLTANKVVGAVYQ
jgi:hypothetical protein